ncbi:pyridoxal phosphate-dependent transferase [Truncatella angustata]|uniref:Pyridoxal phosphate-dependent transferase n=1 Tax=Truncatella angustata TaxID=152316 RepID=A0A9P8UAP1_9PEZI|nr:pyridoxal phosphate-dependent transferase [Truncatella angustata]KAH6639906.1 pyridoxal phosphate-dependent transferase [Truncatella angustata]
MKDLPAFKIDRWVGNYKPICNIMLHGSCASELSLNQLKQLSPDPSMDPIDRELPLIYGSVLGSLKLRSRLAELHSTTAIKLTANNVVITPGSIMANYLVLTTLFSAGDHVICQFPTYAQLYELPRFMGVEVSLWKGSVDDSWTPSVEELENLVQPNTKAIIINNPSNPTGVVLPSRVIDETIAVAKKYDLTIFSDEVFRPLFHSQDLPPPPIVSTGFTSCVSTGSISKAHGLPGVRLGWVISPDIDIIRRIIIARDYTTISVSQLDDSVACFALDPSVLPVLMERNLAKCAASLRMLDDFVVQNAQRCSWVRPAGAGTALVKIVEKNGQPVDDAALCAELAQKYAISLVPGGHCFNDGEASELDGYIRIAIGDDDTLRAGLSVLGSYLNS